MKLNPDCVRKILFYIEKEADYNTDGGFSLKSLATTAGSLSVAFMTNSNALSTFKTGMEYLRSLFC